MQPVNHSDRTPETHRLLASADTDDAAKLIAELQQRAQRNAAAARLRLASVGQNLDEREPIVPAQKYAEFERRIADAEAEIRAQDASRALERGIWIGVLVAVLLAGGLWSVLGWMGVACGALGGFAAGLLVGRAE